MQSLNWSTAGFMMQVRRWTGKAYLHITGSSLKYQSPHCARKRPEWSGIDRTAREMAAVRLSSLKRACGTT